MADQFYVAPGGYLVRDAFNLPDTIINRPGFPIGMTTEELALGLAGYWGPEVRQAILDHPEVGSGGTTDVIARAAAAAAQGTADTALGLAQQGGGGSGSITQLPWSTSWSVAHFDGAQLPEQTVNTALALTSNDNAAVVGGSSMGVLNIVAGGSVSLDGTPLVVTVGKSYSVALINVMGTIIWVSSEVVSKHTVAVLAAPVNTPPTIIGTPTVGSAIAWAGHSVQGNPAPTTVFSWRNSGGLIQDNIQNGAYQSGTAGPFTLRMTSTNSQGTDIDDIPVTVVAAPAIVAPGAPTGLAFSGVTTTGFTANYTAPGSNGGAAITDYRLRISPAGANTWTNYTDGTGASLSIAVAGQTASASLDVQVSAFNSAGWGNWSTTATVQLSSAAAPETLFGQTTVGRVDGSGGPNFVLGNRIVASVGGQVTAAYALCSAAMIGLTVTVAVYANASATTPLATATATVTASGWMRIAFPSPATVAASTFVAAVVCSDPNLYTIKSGTWPTSNGAHLSYDSAWYSNVPAMTNPNTATLGATCTGVDVEFVPS
jgi:hypothetical protein